MSKLQLSKYSALLWFLILELIKSILTGWPWTSPEDTRVLNTSCSWDTQVIESCFVYTIPGWECNTRGHADVENIPQVKIPLHSCQEHMRLLHTIFFMPIGDFRVAFHLCFKTSPSAKRFVWKLVLFTCKLTKLCVWIKLISVWKASH